LIICEIELLTPKQLNVFKIVITIRPLNGLLDNLFLGVQNEGFTLTEFVIGHDNKTKINVKDICDRGVGYYAA
jgi:hypothetical protein